MLKSTPFQVWQSKISFLKQDQVCQVSASVFKAERFFPANVTKQTLNSVRVVYLGFEVQSLVGITFSLLDYCRQCMSNTKGYILLFT